MTCAVPESERNATATTPIARRQVLPFSVTATLGPDRFVFAGGICYVLAIFFDTEFR